MAMTWEVPTTVSDIEAAYDEIIKSFADEARTASKTRHSRRLRRLQTCRGAAEDAAQLRTAIQEREGVALSVSINAGRATVRVMSQQGWIPPREQS